MTPEELITFISAMRANGATLFKTADVHIELGPAPAAAPEAATEPADNGNTHPRKSDYERMLFAATEGLPEEDA